jgi:hypothetical protein
MYPDWPRAPADLVPLSPIEGPKLEPFDFKGLQNIKFIEFVADGTHAHVCKAEILGTIYALKLVCGTASVSAYTY